jgi:hypothetical protein
LNFVNEAPTHDAAAAANALSSDNAELPLVIAPQRGTKHSLIAAIVAIAGWIVPGLGHLLLGRWGRALILLLSVGGLAITGYLLRGNVFPPRYEDPVGLAGFLADAASGMFYFFARFFDPAGANVSHAAGDYGTRFIAAAGIVNLLSVFDAYEIACARRS